MNQQPGAAVTNVVEVVDRRPGRCRGVLTARYPNGNGRTGPKQLSHRRGEAYARVLTRT